MILDLYAGPGGWSTGATMLDATTLGIENDLTTCRTANAAGHTRICADVSTYPTEAVGVVDGLIASPPCPSWSKGGGRGGDVDRRAVYELADRMAEGDDTTSFVEWHDDRSPLVCQPIRWARELQPPWIALENVPYVADLWQHYAQILTRWGYWVWTGVLNAADYGAPQIRKRAILIAHREHAVARPMPSHAREGVGGDLFGGQIAPWRTMRDALGWGMTDRPYPTIASGRTSGGGADAEKVGGSGARAVIYRERDAGRWVDPPDFAGGGALENPTPRNNAVRISLAEASVLQTFPADYPWHGSQTAQFRQIGNAVPPLLAAHVLGALRVGRHTPATESEAFV